MSGPECYIVREIIEGGDLREMGRFDDRELALALHRALSATLPDRRYRVDLEAGSVLEDWQRLSYKARAELCKELEEQDWPGSPCAIAAALLRWAGGDPPRRGGRLCPRCKQFAKETLQRPLICHICGHGFQPEGDGDGKR